MESSFTKTKSFKIIIITLSVIFAIGIILTSTSFAYGQLYQDKIYHGVRIDGFNLGGLNIEQASKVIDGKFNEVYGNGFTFDYQDTSKTIPLFIADAPVISIDSKKMARQAFEYSHPNNWFTEFTRQVRSLIIKKSLEPQSSFDKYILKEETMKQFAAFDDPAQNSEIIVDIKNKKNKDYSLAFTDEKSGTSLSYDQALNQLESSIKNFNNPKISLTLSTDKPKVSKSMAESTTDLIHEIVDLDTLSLTHEKENFDIEWSDYIYWFEITTNEENQPIIQFNHDRVMGQLDSIAQNVNREPKDAKFQIKAGRVTEFQASQSGIQLDQETTYKNLNQEFLINKNNTLPLVVNEDFADITTESVNDLGIKELLGVGRSNFSGSPANRRHNIGVGAAALNGLLIAPGAEFSLIDALGDIDGANGYLQELVIKENRTIPEYGGGLCQVGTTTFRMALDSGVEITERKNHSYRVSYYEPAGTDATIYDPKPDFRFLNDTTHHILIQTKMEGNELIFELWGTDDGRTVDQTYPQIFNITSPGPTKYVDTTELAPGKTKCIESAHNGADAVFYRTVTYANGETKEETWRSHYVPWQQVCLRGIDPDATPEENPDVTTPQQ